jgi:hypothetical protein
MMIKGMQLGNTMDKGKFHRLNVSNGFNDSHTFYLGRSLQPLEMIDPFEILYVSQC